MAKPPTPSRSAGVLQRATDLSSKGEDARALELIEAHLRQRPEDLDARNLAGTLAARLETWPTAERHFAAVLAVRPDDRYALFNIAKVFKLSDRAGAAIEHLGHLLRLDPGHVAALNEIGVLLAGQGHLDPAIQALETAVTLDPTLEKGYRNLYATLYTAARYEEAVAVARRALDQIRSEYRWNFRTDLILCLWKSQAFAEARNLAETLIAELEASDDPKHREILLHALTNYGVILMEMDDPDAAEAQFRKVIDRAPDKVEPYVNLAKLNVYRENLEQAIHWFDRATAIDPEHAELHNHLAIFLRDAGRPDLALPHHLSAVAQSPGNVEMRFYLGITQFALGQLEAAYPNWELRWSRREGGSKSNLPIPEWTGTPATGDALLVYREQGIGDEVLFASCLADLIGRFERIVCVCHSKLQRLFARSYPEIEFRSRDYAFSPSEIASFAWQVPIGSLPPIFRPSVASFPAAPHLLLPDPARVAEFRQRLEPLRHVLTIGIGWRSGLLSLHRKALYPYLEYWQPLFAIPGVTWVNLQYGDVTEELRQAQAAFGVPIVHFADVDHFDDLDTSAALMCACDLVIGPDTSTTQIAAAVGTPTLRIHSGCDYFCLGTDHYPWFPALTAIPRQFGEAWTGPIERTARIIRSLVAERAPGG